MAKNVSISKAFALGLSAVTALTFAVLPPIPPAQAQQVININKPNASGVSINNPPSFNVPKQGLVLNNTNSVNWNCSSATPCTTQLGASITATNPNIGAGNTASLILEEVSAGGSASSLLGYLELFGAKADFILANPNGITCDGCGFINTPRVTLTTGTPDPTGTTYTVTGGNVTIGAGGADLKGLSYFDIIAQSVSAQGGGVITDSSTSTPNQTVRMLAGNNTYTYDQNNPNNFQYSSQGGGSAGATAIDLSLLGGANAGQITLISTNQGAGVNTPASMKAYGGISLTANGKIVFNNATAQGSISAISNGAAGGIAVQSGSQVQAQGANGSVSFLTTTSGDIQLGGSVMAQTTLALKAAQAIAVGSGVTASSGTGSTISAGTSFTNYGTVSSSGASGSSIVAGASFSNYGTVSFPGDTISITAQTGDLTNYTGGLIQAKTLKLAAAATLSNKVNAALTADTAINITSARLLANAGEISAAGAQGAITASVTDLTNSGAGAISGVSVNLDATGTLDNQLGGSIKSGAGMALSASTLLSNEGSIGAGAALSVTTAGDLNNTGQMTAKAGLTAAVSGNLNNADAISGQTVDLAVSGALNNQAGASVISASSTSINAGSLTNAGGIGAGAALRVTTVGDLTNTGQITAQQNGAINAGGALTNDITGKITAGGTLTVSAATLKNFGGADITLPHGVISGLYLIVNAASVQNLGSLLATQNLAINSSGDVVNALGEIKAGGYLAISAAGNFDNAVGIIQGGKVNISAQTMESTVLVWLDDGQLLPKKAGNVLRGNTSQVLAQAVAGWDKSVLAKFSTADGKVLDTLRLQLGEPVMPQPAVTEPAGKGAGKLPQPAGSGQTAHTSAAAGVRPAVF